MTLPLQHDSPEGDFMNENADADMMAHAQSLMDEGKSADARRVLQQIVADDPSCTDAWFLLGVTAHDENDFPQAVASFREYLNARPETAEVHFNLGTILSKLGRTEEAIDAFNAALKWDPELIAAYNNIGLIHRDEGRLQQAREAFERALLIQPQYGPAVINLGLVLTQLRTNEQSQEAERRLDTLRPELAEALYGMSRELNKSGKLENAATLLASAFRLNPDSEAWKFIQSQSQEAAPPATAPTDFVTRVFGTYAPIYEDHMRSVLEYQVPELLLEAVRENAGDRRRAVLDLGCGTGFCGQLFRPMASRLIGIDMTPEMIDECRKRNCYDELRMQSISESLSGVQNEYDLIIAADVFIYVGDVSECFRQVAGALRPGGLFAFSVEACEEAESDGDDGPGFRLGDSLRYGHALSWLRRLAHRETPVERSARRHALRRHREGHAMGWIVVLEKPP